MRKVAGDNSTEDLMKMNPAELHRVLTGIRTALNTEKNRLSIAYAACERLALAIQHLANPQKGKSS